MKFTITVEVEATLDPNGEVRFARVLSQREMRDLIAAQHPLAKRRAMATHATRSRLAEGLVRIEGGAAWEDRLSYGRYVRSTKRYHVIQIGDAERKYRRDRGDVMGGTASFYTNRIHRDDLATLNARAK